MLEILNSYFIYSKKILYVSLGNNYEFKVISINLKSFGKYFLLVKTIGNNVSNSRDYWLVNNFVWGWLLIWVTALRTYMCENLLMVIFQLKLLQKLN